MIDIKQVQDEAKKEFLEEKVKKAKTLVKAKMEEISKAEKVVANLRRELEDLYAEISQS